MNFTPNNIYLAKAVNGEKFVYRCVRAGDICEFVNLMTWKHLLFSETDDFFFVHEGSALFRHEIRPEGLIGEYVDVY